MDTELLWARSTTTLPLPLLLLLMNYVYVTWWGCMYWYSEGMTGAGQPRWCRMSSRGSRPKKPATAAEQTEEGLTLTIHGDWYDDDNEEANQFWHHPLRSIGMDEVNVNLEDRSDFILHHHHRRRWSLWTWYLSMCQLLLHNKLCSTPVFRTIALSSLSRDNHS